MHINHFKYKFYINCNRVSIDEISNVKVLKIDDLISTIINDLKSDGSMIISYEEMDQMYIEMIL